MRSVDKTIERQLSKDCERVYKDAPINVALVFQQIYNEAFASGGDGDSCASFSDSQRELYERYRLESPPTSEIIQGLEEWGFLPSPLQEPKMFFSLGGVMVDSLSSITSNALVEQLAAFRSTKKYLVTTHRLRSHAAIESDQEGNCCLVFSNYLFGTLVELSYFLAVCLLKTTGTPPDEPISSDAFDPKRLTSVFSVRETGQWMEDILTFTVLQEKYALVGVCDPHVLNGHVRKGIYDAMTLFLVNHELGHLIYGHLKSKANLEGGLKFFEEMKAAIVAGLTKEHPGLDATAMVEAFEQEYGTVFLNEIEADDFALKHTTSMMLDRGYDPLFTLAACSVVLNVIDFFEDEKYQKAAGFGKKVAWVDDVVHPRLHPHAYTRLTNALGYFTGTFGNQFAEIAISCTTSVRELFRMPKIGAVVQIEKIREGQDDYSVFHKHGYLRYVCDHTSAASISGLQVHLASLSAANNQ